VITSVSALEETTYARAPQPAPHVAEAHQPRVEQMSFGEKLSYAPAPDRISRASMEWQLGAALQSVMEAEDDALALKLPPNWRIAGYLHNTYIVIESSEGMLLVEQHIAHERTLYERILAAQTVKGRVSDNSQQLLIAQPLDLSAIQSSVLEQHGETLSKLGFEFECGRDGTVTCTQVPVQLAHKNYASVIHEMLETLSTTDDTNIELEATKSIACQAAIKNGMSLGPSEIEKLLHDWLATPRNDTCPHGRPIVLKFTNEKLFQLFHPA
jgi:DNA mismatch repair protein MutL